ncbi:hypothetical protein HPB51_020493 [Rhipicephalus microplus]|uniref:Uncharacterized protein n=1 Tax=Rhipicephalus microplus TaxID=6941 RepID=A0A9J6E315_RHIMP|nr:hypothetical protein HPB51_020493 [Rhipicephalus microplus]
MKCSSVALGLATAQLVAGLGLTVLPIHTMLKLPSLATRDCPLWAAGPRPKDMWDLAALFFRAKQSSDDCRRPSRRWEDSFHSSARLELRAA